MPPSTRRCRGPSSRPKSRRLAAEQGGKPATVEGGQPQQGPAAPQQQQPVAHVGGDKGVVEDVLRSSGAGLRTGVESIFGTPQDLIGLGAAGVNKLFGTDYTGDVPYLPSSEDIHEKTSEFVGPSYQPQTTAGKFARTASEFAGGSLLPGGLAKNAVRAGIGAAAGLASEGAGQATEGTALEPWARAAGGLAAGGGLEAGRSGIRNLQTAPVRQAEAAAEEAAARHGVRLTKGERSGDVAQQQKEQQMLHGAKGGWAQRLMEQRRQENLQGVKDASASIQDTAAPSRGATPADSAATLNWSSRRRVEQAKREGGAKIKQALTANQMIDAERLRGLPDEISAKLIGPDPFVPEVAIDDLTPAAKKAMDYLERYAKQVEDPKKFKEVSLAQAERLRRNIGKLDPANKEDARALGAIREYFDDWLEQGVSDPAVLAELKAGRAQSKEGLQVEHPRRGTVGGPEVARVVKEGQHAEDTARLFKPNDRGTLSGAAIDAITQLKKTGATGGELDQVRGIVLDQLMSGDPGKVATRIDNFIRENPTAAADLFSPEQLKSIQEWGGTNKALVPDPKATNPSKSSYGIISELGKRAAQQATTSGGVIGTLLGGPVGTIAGAGIGAGMAGLEKLGGFQGAREALKGVNRDTLAKAMQKGAVSGTRSAAQGATQGAQTLTITDPVTPTMAPR